MYLCSRYSVSAYALLLVTFIKTSIHFSFNVCVREERGGEGGVELIVLWLSSKSIVRYDLLFRSHIKKIARLNSCFSYCVGSYGVTQVVERQTPDPKTRGSNPVRSTRKICNQKCCADSLMVCPTPVCIRMHKNVHVYDPVVHVRVWWITKT